MGSTQKQYGPRWERARKLFLKEHPLCVMCLAYGRVEVARVVDHIRPHKGDQKLFWDASNWQSLCFNHHNSDARQIENGRQNKQTIGVDGWPVDDPSEVKIIKQKKNPRGGEDF